MGGRNNLVVSSSYTPDESHYTIIQEETWLQGTLLSNFFFGIQTTLCIFAFFSIYKNRIPRPIGMRIGLLIYLAVLFAITTAAQGLLLEWVQMGFITQRNYPGGPSAFFSNEYSITVDLVCTILTVCANWMMESLMVWRCYVVCNSGGRHWSLGVIIPSFLIIAVFVTGGLFIHSILHSDPPTSYVLAYAISSLVLNLAATGIIAGRLLAYRHAVVSQLGRAHGRHYVSITVVVVESAAVYTSFLVVVIVAYAVGSPATNLLQQVIEQVQTITSLIIILRIARGEGWRKSTQTELVSAAMSSWNTRVELVSEQSVINLEAVSTQPGGGTNVSRKQDEGPISFSNDAAV